jgi:hypothetical protein
MTEHDKKWNMKYAQLVEFKRKKGHCMVPQKYEQDKTLGMWVSHQRNYHKINRLRQDRKMWLDEIGFVWKRDGAHTMNQQDKLWYQQYAKIVEFKRKNGHCLVKKCYEQDKSLAHWVSTQRTIHINDKIRLNRKRLLDEIGFAWKDEGSHNYSNQCVKLWYQLHSQLETEPAAQGHMKRPISTCLAKSGQMAASTNKRDEATCSCTGSVEEDIGRHENDSKPSAVTSAAALIGSISREVVQDEATYGEIPSCWKVSFPF